MTQTRASSPRRPRSLLRWCLDPLRPVGQRLYSPRQFTEALAQANATSLFTALNREGVAALWWHFLGETVGHDGCSQELRQLFGEHERHAIARSLQQEAGLFVVADALEAAGVRWVTFKGAHLCRSVYPTEHLREGIDIDLVVAPEERLAALQSLESAGFEARPDLAGASGDRELPLFGHGVSIDLHWAVLRPGRSRLPLADALLARRRQIGNRLWVPHPQEALTIALLHTAITEHVTGRLLKAVDLQRLLAASPAPELATVAHTIRRTGLAPAAWAMLTWAASWLGPEPFAPLAAELRPGPLRRGYLRAWLGLDPADLYQRHPTLVRAAFSLTLQQTPADAWRAWSMRRRALDR